MSTEKDTSEYKHPLDTYNVQELQSRLMKAELAADKWISIEEYEKLVYEKLGDKPVIAQFIKDGFPFSKWHENIHQMVDKEMGVIREVRVNIL